MTYYFGGNMQAAWDRSSSLVVGTTLAGTFDPAVVGSSVLIPASASGLWYSAAKPIVVNGPSLTSKVFGHFEFSANWGATAGNGLPCFIRVRNLSGIPVFQLRNATAGFLQCEFWNGAAMVAVGPALNVAALGSGLSSYDYSFLPGASGTFELRLNGNTVPLFSVSGFNAAVNNAALFEVGNVTLSPAYVSQGILADFDLRGAKFLGQRPTGNGFHTDGTGTFTDVNTIVTVDTTGIGLPVVGNRKSFTHDTFAAPGMVIDAVFINAPTAVSGGVVNNLRGIVRRAGTTTATGNVAPAPVLGIEQRSVVMELDPSTGLAWTVANYNASEIGVEGRG